MKPRYAPWVEDPDDPNDDLMTPEEIEAAAENAAAFMRREKAKEQGDGAPDQPSHHEEPRPAGGDG
jgi:hypothetical protein